MVTPKREKILARAIELWKTDQYRNGCSELAEANPEYSELLESGYIAASRSELMRDQHRSEVESKNYLPEFPSKLQFDVAEGLKTGFYISGTTGTGKSDVVMYIADILMREGITVFVFDPSQDWMTRSSIPYCLMVDAEKPLDVVLNGHSTVFDMSILTIPQQKILVEWFCKTIFEHQARIPNENRKQYFIIFEEAHTYFPEGCMRSKTYQNAVRLLTQGRNYKVRMGCVTQFSSLVDKNVMRYMKQRYFGYTDELNDVYYLKAFLDSHASKLRGLGAGEFLYYHAGDIQKISIESYENSTTPKTQHAKIPDVKPQQTSSGSAFLVLSVLLGLAFLIGWFLP